MQPGEDPARLVQGRTKSYSKDDQKRMMHNPWMQDESEKKEGGDGRNPPKSPGVGNSEVMGREFGFTSAG